MSHVICVDGLGGDPVVTFGKLKTALEAKGHTVHLAPIEGVTPLEDRTDLVFNTVQGLRSNYPTVKYFLVGQLEGGSAVLCAAAELADTDLPHRIILLSSSVSRAECNKPLGCPCTLMCGEKDRQINRRGQEKLAQRMRDNMEPKRRSVISTHSIRNVDHLTLPHDDQAIGLVCRSIH